MIQSEAVLVAGGAGYIGSHTAKQMRQAGMTPVVIDNLCSGHRSAVRYGPFAEGSIADQALVRKVIEDHGIRSAILFAGYIAVGESTENPRKFFDNNVAAAIAFLNAFLDAGGRYVVFSSTCAIYGAVERIPISEDTPTGPMSPYAHTKLFVEHVLEAYDRAYGLRSACLRYFNAAGADPEGELGERHDPETHLIPLAIQSALQGRTLRVFGTDYPTPDGTALRDYIHVTDLAQAHITALNVLRMGGPSMQVNLGTGKGYSVREVIQSVEKAAGTTLPIEYHPRRDGDVPALVADPRRAQQLLDWDPQFSSLDTIIQTAWRWHRDLEPAMRSNQGQPG